MKERRVHDTSKDHPLTHILGGMSARQTTGKASNYIEQQEAIGQRELVMSTQLPVNGTKDKEAEWEALGVKLGPVDDEDIFRIAELPEGWSKKADPTHFMWSYLLDDKGRARASIFYKAAFYDRKAHVRFSQRYCVQERLSIKWGGDCPEGHVCYRVVDQGEEDLVLFESLKEVPEGVSDYEIRDLCRKECRSWLDANYPDHLNAHSYWD